MLWYYYTSWMRTGARHFNCERDVKPFFHFVLDILFFERPARLHVVEAGHGLAAALRDGLPVASDG